jgi:GxxExxY protein
MDINQLTEKVIGCAIEVHKNLGPGLLESTYEVCLAYELTNSKIPFQRQRDLPVTYKDIRLDCGYRLDFLVDDCLILEIKSVEAILPVHEAQLLTYLKLSGRGFGLLLNFNVRQLKQGIKRMVVN